MAVLTFASAAFSVIAQSSVVLTTPTQSKASSSASAVSQLNAAPPPANQAFRFEPNGLQGQRLAIAVRVAPGTYLYRDKLAIKIGKRSVAQKSLRLPAGEPLRDAFFGSVLALRGNFEVSIPLTTTEKNSSNPLVVEIRSQGCADIGVCYPPQSERLSINGQSGLLASATTSPAQGTQKGDPSPGPAQKELELQARRPFQTVANPTELAKALRSSQGSPVMIDFWATWCLPCKHMDATTFADPIVKARLSGFSIIKVDVTRNDAASKAMLAQYGLMGPPGLLFFDAAGRELPSKRIVGVVAAEPFIAHLDRLFQ